MCGLDLLTEDDEKLLGSGGRNCHEVDEDDDDTVLPVVTRDSGTDTGAVNTPQVGKMASSIAGDNCSNYCSGGKMSTPATQQIPQMASDLQNGRLLLTEFVFAERMKL